MGGDRLMMADQVRIHLEELGMTEAASVLDHRAEQASKNSWSYIEFVDRLLVEELTARRQRSLETRTRLARVPRGKTLDAFDFEAQPGVDEQLIRDLATLSFLDRTDNVCLLGPPGVGKTHLAVALALRALEEGYTAYFTTLDRMIVDLKKAEAEHKLEKRFRAYLKPKALVVDEMGYLPLDRDGANLLFQLVSRRYERGSILLTSNKGYGDWASFLGDPVLAAAILDRLLHHSVTVNIRGDSYRLRLRDKAGLETVPPAGEVRNTR